VTGTITTLPQAVTDAKIGPPAITIIGQVVEMRRTINWFETRPLFGQTIVVTRTREQASDLSARLEELGARVIEAPTLELVPPADWSGVDAALRSIATYDWVIFTSANGVRFTKKRLLELELDARAFGDARIGAVGDATARAIGDELCLKVDLFPKPFVAEALASELIDRGQVKGKRFLMLRADIARTVLREKLNEAGAAAVEDVAVYESRPVGSLPPILLEALKDKQVHWITFASSSTAKNLATLLGKDFRQKLRGIKLASIGPITTATMKELGLEPTVQA